MTDITPPPELVQQWFEEQRGLSEASRQQIATQAARWGADQELEACLVEIRDGAGRIYIDETRLRVLLAEDIWTARRPKPPSLKELALEALDQADKGLNKSEWQQCSDTIRRALEELP
jgi:hypothetical protein